MPAPDTHGTPDWFTRFAAAIDAGEQTYLVCSACDGTSLPPRSLCPACGHDALEERPLSDTATVESFTAIHVTTPAFDGTTPYTVVLAAFDEGVRLAGQLRGDDVAVGDTVTLGTDERPDGRPVPTFTPAGTDA